MKLSDNDLAAVNAGSKGILRTQNQPAPAAMVFGAQPVTQILAIDGKALASTPLDLDEEYAIDTGAHRVKVACVNRQVSDERDYSKVIEVEVKAFHQYSISCSFDTEFGADGTYSGSFSVGAQPIHPRKP